jgi:hypothetical protein
MTRQLFALVMLLVGMAGCQKDSHRYVLRQLYKKYKNGEISECRWHGQLVYSGGINAYDAGSAIYDEHGNEIGRCNYAWGSVDSICYQLENCETVYRVKDNIWGKPPVNKYKLGW